MLENHEQKIYIYNDLGIYKNLFIFIHDGSNENYTEI